VSERDTYNNSIDTSHAAFVLSLFDTGLAVLRHLNARRVKTFGFDDNIKSCGFRTNVAKTEICPSPQDTPKDLLSFLIQRSKGLKNKPVLFPASDLYVIFVSEYREQLKPYFLFILPEVDVAQKFFSKEKQGEWAAQAGAFVPKEFSVFAHDNINIPKIDFPVFIKGIESHIWQQAVSGKGFIAHNENELKTTLNRLAKLNLNSLVQEIIPGPASNNYEVSYYISSQGQTFGPFIMQKLRQFPVDFGVGTIGESIHSEKIKKIADSLIEKMQIRGFANMELKWDPRDKEYKYIETNIRVWQQIDLCHACGWDLASIQYLDLTGQDVKSILPQSNYLAGQRWIDPWNDIYSFLVHWGDQRLSFRTWFESWKNIISWGSFSKTDLKPACQWYTLLMRSLNLVKMFMLQFKKRLKT
jgi:predicted ATP-grasp superfamily ATP-dependent carboligase